MDKALGIKTSKLNQVHKVFMNEQEVCRKADVVNGSVHEELEAEEQDPHILHGTLHHELEQQLPDEESLAHVLHILSKFFYILH